MWPMLRHARGSAPSLTVHRCSTLRRHRRERGLTLIETLVTIGLLALGIIGVAAGLTEAERVASINQDQSQLEVYMRQLADFVRDSNPATGLDYDPCSYVTSAPSASANGATSPGANSAKTYAVQLASAVPGKLGAPPGHWGFKQILESPSSGASGTSVAPAYSTSGCQAATGSADWGVQKIQLIVFNSSGTRSLTRWVWKSFAWCYQSTSGAC